MTKAAPALLYRTPTADGLQDSVKAEQDVQGVAWPKEGPKQPERKLPDVFTDNSPIYFFYPLFPPLLITSNK